MSPSNIETQPAASPGAPQELGFKHQDVGVIGTGRMGLAFASNLIEDGYSVSVYDRDPERAHACVGAKAVADIAELAHCDLVFTSLPDDDALAT
jgi:3-hydroxyisobutyrate dehydrogenase-like beta-hydroxyacid dehydrogenase